MIGDGDFSFSLALAKRNIPHSLKLIATSLETLDHVVAQPGAAENIHELRKRGVTVIHAVDGTAIKECQELKTGALKFDTIIFNFPHVGGKGNIKRNRQLLRDFFKSAVNFLEPLKGEVHVALCKGQGGTPMDCAERGYGNTWKAVEMAAESGLMLTRIEAFEPSDFPGYRPTGYRGQHKGFLLGGALTHVFALPRVDSSLSPWRQLGEGGYYEPCSLCFPDEPSVAPAVQLQLSLGLPEEKLQFPALLQPWHPLTLMVDAVKELLTQSNCLWKSVDFSDQRRVVCHRLPSDCVPDEAAAARLHPAVFRSPGLATTSPSGGSSHYASGHRSTQPDLLCLRTSELEIFRLASMLLAAGHSEPVLRLTCGPSVRNPPLSLDPINQPLTHEVVGVFSVKHLLEKGQLDDGLVACFEKVMTEVLRGVLEDSAHLTRPGADDGENGLQFLWRDSCDCTHLRSCRELCLGTSGNLLPGPVLRFGRVSCRRKVDSAVGGSLDVLMGFVLYVAPLTMLHFGIEDVRLFWSKDTRFASQFLVENPRRVAFKPFSLFPPTYVHDLSFWGRKTDCSSTAENSEGEFSELQLVALIRRLSNSCAVSLQCIDTYLQPGSQAICGRKPKCGYCYRLLYRSVDRALSRTEAAALQLQLREAVQKELCLELR